MTVSRFDSAAAARLLLEARNGGPKPDRLTSPLEDRTSAYAVQEAVMSGLDDPGNVWKMGMLGGVQREAAVLPRRFLHLSGARLDLPENALIEVEIAVILDADPGPGADHSDVMSSIASVHLAFEVIASRFILQAAATPLEQMADSFSSAAIVIGSEIAGWRDSVPDTLGITLTLDGTQIRVPENAFSFIEALDFIRWLSRHARSHGRPLGSDCVIITGARVGPVPISQVETARATTAGATAEVNFCQTRALLR